MQRSTRLGAAALVLAATFFAGAPAGATEATAPSDAGAVGPQAEASQAATPTAESAHSVEPQANTSVAPQPTEPTPEPAVETPAVPTFEVGPIDVPPAPEPPVPAVEAPAPPPPSVSAPALPPGSGAGRRVVYSNSRQRVWFVEGDGRIARSYLVSGRTGVPRAGTYRVFSRSRVSYSTGGARLDYMVRFARGRTLSIGFHAIPVGRRGPIQSEAQLGTPRSLGCVRQANRDAAAMWDFGQLGTTVVVTP